MNTYVTSNSVSTPSKKSKSNKNVSTQAYAAPLTVTNTTVGLDCLGCGVDAATGSYLSSYKEQIFDPTQLAAVTQLTTLNSSQTSCIAEQDSVSYLTQQTSKTGISGGYAGFSASVETSFGLTSSQESTNSLATYTQITQLYQLTIPVSARTTMMTDGFKEALYTMPAQEFYDKYGAYFTSTIVVGGSLSSSVQTAQTQTFDETSFAVNAQASYDEGIANCNVQTSYTYTNSVTHTTYQCNKGIVIVGGNLTPTYTPEGAFDVNAWSLSVQDNPAVVSWQELTPMWELIVDDDERVSELKGAIDAYFCEPNSYTLAPLTLKTFTSSAPASNGPESVTVKVPAGYKVLCGGAYLNQGSNGNQFLTNSYPVYSSTPNQWTASGKSVHNSTNATLTAYAVATYDPFDLLDVKVFKANTTQNEAHPTTNCIVGSGYVLTGGGVATTPTNSNGLMLTASYPSDNSTWTGMAKDHKASCPGTITVSAIGVKWRNPNGKPTLQCEITSNPSSISGSPSQYVSAGSNATLVGGGAYDNWGNGCGNMLQASYPTVDSDKNQVWMGSGHDAGTSDKCTLTAYAVGLQVAWTNENGETTLEAFGPGCLTQPYEG